MKFQKWAALSAVFIMGATVRCAPHLKESTFAKAHEKQLARIEAAMENREKQRQAAIEAAASKRAARDLNLTIPALAGAAKRAPSSALPAELGQPWELASPLEEAHQCSLFQGDSSPPAAPAVFVGGFGGSSTRHVATLLASGGSLFRRFLPSDPPPPTPRQITRARHYESHFQDSASFKFGLPHVGLGKESQ